MRMEGNKLIGSVQIEGHNHGNVTSAGIGSRGKETEKAQNTGGRKYKQGFQKESGGTQTTLNSFWLGKEKDMQTWSKEMEELDDMDKAQEKASQETALSYV